MNEHLNEKISRCLSMVGPAWAAMDFRTFADTADIFMYDPLIAEPWTRLHTLPMIEAAENSSLDKKELARHFHNPTALRELFLFDLLMAKEARFGVDVYLSIFSFYSSLLEAWCLHDPFTENGNNIIYTSGEVEHFVSRCDPATPEIAKELGKLANACYNISYSLYSDMNPQLVYDNLGPHYRNDRSLFVKKLFYNLKPTELWPETQILPVDNIAVSCLYKDVTMKVDMASHAIYQGNQITGLLCWSCEADGQPVDLPQIHSIRTAIEKVSITLWKKIKTLDLEDKKNLYYRQKAWGYKKLFDRLGLDWRPNDEVLFAAANKPLFTKWNFPDKPEAAVRFLETIMDPRMEIPEAAYI